MKELFSIRSREITYRVIIVAIILVFGGITLFSVIYANQTAQKSLDNIYILQNSTSIVKASPSDITNSYDM